MDYFIIALLLVAGLSLIVLEIIIMPGLITGIFGFLLIVTSIVYAFIKLGTTVGVFSILISISFYVALLLAIRKLGLWRRFVLNEKTNWKAIKTFETQNGLIGKEGVALTDLKPSGFIFVEGKKIDASSYGEFIPKNSRVKIILIDGIKITVKKIEG